MAKTDGVAQFQRNVQRVVDGVRAHAFASALEAACRVLVNESKNKSRPLAWNDITGNLRASISFQIEGVRKAPVVLSRDGSGVVYNLVDYVSSNDRRDGEYGVVYAPPEYAIHVEAKQSRSVLLEPVATVQAELLRIIGNAAKKDWVQFASQTAVGAARGG